MKSNHQLLVLVPVGNCNLLRILMAEINHNKKGGIFLELFWLFLMILEGF
jgi:hypothetical protein